MPCAPVGLILERARERLMGLPAVGQAGALCDRRANEWMPEADGLQIGGDDAGLDRRRSVFEIESGPGDRAARGEDLLEVVLVAERRHKHDQASRLGQL